MRPPALKPIQPVRLELGQGQAKALYDAASAGADALADTQHRAYREAMRRLQEARFPRSR